jgi:hypothetical protein
VSFFIEDTDWIDRDYTAKQRAPRAGMLVVGEKLAPGETLAPFVADECPVWFDEIEE